MSPQTDPVHTVPLATAKSRGIPILFGPQLVMLWAKLAAEALFHNDINVTQIGYIQMRLNQLRHGNLKSYAVVCTSATAWRIDCRCPSPSYELFRTLSVQPLPFLSLGLVGRLAREGKGGVRA
jgi:hypothetical protein